MHGEQRVDHLLAHAGMPACERRRLHRNHQPHDRRLQRLTDAHAVRADQVELQRVELVLADALVRKLAEAGVDAVDGLAALRGALHDLRTRSDRCACAGVQLQAHAVGVDGLELFQRELAWSEREFVSHERPTL